MNIAYTQPLIRFRFCFPLFFLELSPVQLKNNTKICEELLRLADVLEPGITRFRGLLLFYLVRGLKRLNGLDKYKRVGIVLLFCFSVFFDYNAELTLFLCGDSRFRAGAYFNMTFEHYNYVYC